MRGLIENTNFSRPSVRTQGHYIDMLSILSPQFRRDTARRRRAGERVARSRCRLRANEIMAPVVVTHPIIELLISTGSLDVEQSEDRNAVGAERDRHRQIPFGREAFCRFDKRDNAKLFRCATSDATAGHSDQAGSCRRALRFLALYEQLRATAGRYVARQRRQD